MNDEKFCFLLQKAKKDSSALYEIISMYENLTIKNSFINGRFDEDCKAYIECAVISAIKNFKIF